MTVAVAPSRPRRVLADVIARPSHRARAFAVDAALVITGAAVVAMGWSAVVVFSVRGLPATWPVEATQQLVYLVLAIAACAVLLVRARTDRRIGAVL